MSDVLGTRTEINGIHRPKIQNINFWFSRLIEVVVPK